MVLLLLSFFLVWSARWADRRWALRVASRCGSLGFGGSARCLARSFGSFVLGGTGCQRDGFASVWRLGSASDPAAGTQRDEVFCFPGSRPYQPRWVFGRLWVFCFSFTGRARVAWSVVSTPVPAPHAGCFESDSIIRTLYTTLSSCEVFAPLSSLPSFLSLSLSLPPYVSHPSDFALLFFLAPPFLPRPLAKDLGFSRARTVSPGANACAPAPKTGFTGKGGEKS
jgi:hypothetical protein